MKLSRPWAAALASTAVLTSAALVPLVAHAAQSSSAPCATQRTRVQDRQDGVDQDIDALVQESSVVATTPAEKRRKAKRVAAARAALRGAQHDLATAQRALTSCLVAAQPAPTTTVTATATATTTATATATATTTATTTATATATVSATPAPSPLVWAKGTARLTQTEPDLSAIPALSYWDGVPISGTGFGSAWTEDPAHPGYFYGLTDRGPNVTAPDTKAKLEPMPTFQNQIGYFHLVAGDLELVKVIGLTLPNGKPMNGLVNTEADTGESIIDPYGDVYPHSAGGLDSEGLVALADGTFWVSDEYGPFVVHFSAAGQELERFDPYVTAAGTSTVFGDSVHPLPGELKKRKPNKGMEGLTVTPDGHYLVGIMQSSLDKNGTSATTSATGAITRIVKISLTDPADVHEYLYSLHTSGVGNPSGEAVSEITALPGDDNHFLVDERDGNAEGLNSDGSPKAVKNLWSIDLSAATDVGPASPLVGTTTAGGAVTYSATTGLQVGGKTVEDLAGTQTGAAAVASLAAAGIAAGTEALYLDYAGLVSAIDPTGVYFGHDKVEGIAVDAANPNIVYLSNDSDFGITDLPGGANPTANTRARGTDAEKFLRDGTTQDFGEVLEVDMSQVPAAYKGS